MNDSYKHLRQNQKFINPLRLCACLFHFEVLTVFSFSFSGKETQILLMFNEYLWSPLTIKDSLTFHFKRKELKTLLRPKQNVVARRNSHLSFIVVNCQVRNTANECRFFKESGLKIIDMFYFYTMIFILYWLLS